MLLIIIASLAEAAFGMLAKERSSERVVRALTRRIAFSVVLFVLVLLAIGFGYVTPNEGP